jgi:hypothetical protein
MRWGWLAPDHERVTARTIASGPPCPLFVGGRCAIYGKHPAVCRAVYVVGLVPGDVSPCGRIEGGRFATAGSLAHSIGFGYRMLTDAARGRRYRHMLLQEVLAAELLGHEMPKAVEPIGGVLPSGRQKMEDAVDAGEHRGDAAPDAVG